MTEKEKFIKVFGSRFWTKLKGSIVETKSENKDVFLNKLYKDIKYSTYYPSIPNEYIISPKTNNAVRIIPVFKKRDSCVYFYCIKAIDEFLANEGDRVPGTFGGWTLSNGLKKSEDKEIAENEDFATSEMPYDIDNSFNPFAWRNHWKQFQKLAYDYSRTGEYNSVVQFDIANFYDGIRLNTLENQVREAVSKESKTFELNLLFHLLRNWNRVFEGYGLKAVGLPQDEIGDCSRILANFYLREYDKKVYELCYRYDCKYLRYADDQVLFLKDPKDKNYLLTEISKYLYQLGLNINAHKIKTFSPEEYNAYWIFELFSEMTDWNIKDPDKVVTYVDTFIEMIAERIDFRRDSVLKRLLVADWSKLGYLQKKTLEKLYFDESFLAGANFWYMEKLLNKVDNQELFRKLDSLIDSVYFNSFHYNLLKFYRQYRKGENCRKIKSKINKLKISLLI